MKDIETEFPGIVPADASAIAKSAKSAKFLHDGYDIVVNRAIAARGTKVVLGTKPELCRFCGRERPATTFKKEAHAVPELAGNRTLISLYECDECNDRFSAFEDDLGKLTLLERIAGQVLGKSGVPSAKTRQKKSRISVELTGFKIEEHAEDSIVEFDHDRNEMTVSIDPQPHRPLGVYKALVKIALTLMTESDLAAVPEALRWLRSPDLETDRIDDGVGYKCFRSWTPGPSPFAQTHVMLLRRKRDDVPGPYFIFLLAFGNLSFQIVVPAPRKDKYLIGQTVNLAAVPIFPLLDAAGVRGRTVYWVQDLSSTQPHKGSRSVTFHFDGFEGSVPGNTGDGQIVPEASPPPEDPAITAPTAFLREAIKQVPSVRYAFGAAGIAAAGALITLFLGYGRPAVIVWIGTFIAMILLLLFASVATSQRTALRRPGMLLINAVALFFCLFLAFTVTAFAFSWPSNWAKFLGIDLSGEIQNFSVVGDVVNFGCERGATSHATYAPPPGFRILNAHAETYDVVGAKSASAVVTSAPGDRTASGKADFFGRDLEWTRNCPGGGHGRVRLLGNYVREHISLYVLVPAASVFLLAAIAAAFAILPGRPFSGERRGRIRERL